MKITADTNVLVRVAVKDEPAQARSAAAALKDAHVIAIPLTVLCEFCWVLRAVYGFSSDEIARALRTLAGIPNVVLNHAALESGLKLLEAGGDFADGVIAHDGALMGGDTFVSFDKTAVRHLKKQGREARMLA